MPKHWSFTQQGTSSHANTCPTLLENLEMTHFLRTFAFASANFTTSWQSATSYDKIILANTKNIHRHGVIA